MSFVDSFSSKVKHCDRLGTATRVFRKNGELFAVAHKLPNERPSSAEPFVPTTEYKGSYKTPTTQDMMKEKKPLVKYDPHANRNRNPVRFDNEPTPYVRFCAPRNVSQFELKYGTTDASKQFATTNKVTYIPQKGTPTGFNHTGIVAEKTKFFHKLQTQ